MDLTICHLYPDLLNTYGDFGNLVLIQNRCRERGIDCAIENISVNDTLDIQRADIVFLGGGQDFEQTIVSEDLMAHKREVLRSYVEDGGVLLSVCGGYQLMGEYYAAPNGERVEGLGILPIYTESGKKRLIGNIVLSSGQERYVGFENHSGKTYIGALSPLGEVLYGFGNNGEDKKEGCVYKNCLCTYLHGPLLSKNPELSDRLIQAALEQKYHKKVALEPLDDSYEQKAKEAMLSRLLNTSGHAK